MLYYPIHFPTVELKCKFTFCGTLLFEDDVDFEEYNAANILGFELIFASLRIQDLKRLHIIRSKSGTYKRQLNSPFKLI